MKINVLPNHITLPLLAVVMLLGNGALIVLILRNKRLRTATNLVIVSLATSDLLMGVLVAPLLVGRWRHCLHLQAIFVDWFKFNIISINR